MMKDHCRDQNAPPNCTRRAIAGGVAFGFLGFLTAGWFRLSSRPATAEAAVLSLLRHRASASEVGHLALQSWPEMRQRKELVGNIVADLGLESQGAALVATEELGRRMSERIALDFSVGRVVKLDGWLLALSEVRLCALAALNSRRAA